MPILEDFLINLAAGLTQQLLQAIHRKLNKPQRKALANAYESGFEYMLRIAGQGRSKAEIGRISEVFSSFLAQPGVADTFLDIALSSQDVDLDVLARQFRTFGGPALLQNIPFDFDRSVLALQHGLTQALIAEARADESPLHNQVSLDVLLDVQRMLQRVEGPLFVPPPIAPPAATPPTPILTPPSAYHSCFTSYASEDEAFVEKLYADLVEAGIQCWYAPENMPIGAKIRQTLDDAIGGYGRLLIVLSEHSIKSHWVEKEVETAFEKERITDDVLLFPLRLDDVIWNTPTAWAADIRRTRNIGDFSAWQEDDVYRRQLRRVLRDLRI